MLRRRTAQFLLGVSMLVFRVPEDSWIHGPGAFSAAAGEITTAFDPLEFLAEEPDAEPPEETFGAWSAALLPRWVKATDERIGDPTVSYKDPEFAPGAPLITWQDEVGRIWICAYNQRTGDLIPQDGRGLSPGVGVPIFSPFTSSLTRIGTNNGPEWGHSRRGYSVFFMQGNRTLGYRVSRYGLRDRSLTTVTPEGVPVAAGAFASVDSRDPLERLLYGRLVDPRSNNQLIAGEWLNLGTADPPVRFPVDRIGTAGPRWIVGERAIMTTKFDADGISQIARYDIDSGETTLLTGGPGNKFDGFFIRAPEQLGRRVLCCVIDQTRVAFYRPPKRSETTWQLLRELTPPLEAVDGEMIRATGIAPFVYRGRSYVTYLATLTRFNARICLASLDGSINTVISEATPENRFDPEVLITQGRLFVYYWIGRQTEAEVEQLRRISLRIYPAAWLPLSPR
ncbi:MAG: hypothetical protein SFV23_23075 [Planctomycetaceae bacterium]|nr:hypothetical protein [Planctomycetaceae bacterium]